MKTKVIDIPDCDCDLVLKFPSGAELLIQARPSNADVNYKGSLDIVLPENEWVTTWRGDDMESSDASGDQSHIRWAKQLVVELP